MNEQWIDDLRAERVDTSPRPGFKDELRATLVAEYHGITPPSSPATIRHRRAWLAAAAAACVALLIGGLVVFGGTDRTLTPSTAPDPTTAPSPLNVPSTDGEPATSLTQSGTGSLPAADPPAMGALGNDDGGPAHDLDDDGVIASTTIISPQSCSPVTFTFPAQVGNTKLNVTTVTLDRTGAGVFLTPTLTVWRGGTAPDDSSPAGIIHEVVVADIGTVAVPPARSGTVGPLAYGTLPTSDGDIDDLSNGTSGCDRWGIAAHTESVTIDDLVAFLERVTIAS